MANCGGLIGLLVLVALTSAVFANHRQSRHQNNLDKKLDHELGLGAASANHRQSKDQDNLDKKLDQELGLGAASANPRQSRDQDKLDKTLDHELGLDEPDADLEGRRLDRELDRIDKEIEYKYQSERRRAKEQCLDPITKGLQVPDDQILIVTNQTSEEIILKKLSAPGGNDDSFYLVDIQDLIHKWKVWHNALPRVRPFFAVKCNSSPLVLRTLAALGFGFDAASKAEIDTVLALGVSPDDIIYAHTIKSISDLHHAHISGVNLMTFDNEDELLKLAGGIVHPNAQLVFRLFVNNSEADFVLGEKFGAKINDAGPLLMLAKKLDLEVVGVSFHIGSGSTSAAPYFQAIADARAVFDMAQVLGFNMTLLDIGGGMPGLPTAKLGFLEMSVTINRALEEHFPEVDARGRPSKVRVIAEPGRYVASSAFTLITRIVGKRQVKEPNGQKTMYYYINDGIHGAFRFYLLDHAAMAPLPIIDQNSRRTMSVLTDVPSRIWGPTCDSHDYLPTDYRLPLMEIGEWLMFRGMGAYSITTASLFNGFPLPKATYIVQPEDFETLRKSPYWSGSIGMPIRIK